MAIPADSCRPFALSIPLSCLLYRFDHLIGRSGSSACGGKT
jgi:hypothetical protein